MGGDPQLLPRCLHRAGREKPPTSSSLSRSSRLQPLAWDHYREFNRGSCNIVQGVESQRPWTEQAMARTTPCLLRCFHLSLCLSAICTSGDGCHFGHPLGI